MSWLGYLGEADFWNRSFQNWQSEFLAVGSMAVFSRLPAPARVAGVQAGRRRARRDRTRPADRGSAPDAPGPARPGRRRSCRDPASCLDGRLHRGHGGLRVVPAPAAAPRPAPPRRTAPRVVAGLGDPVGVEHQGGARRQLDVELRVARPGGRRPAARPGLPSSARAVGGAQQRPRVPGDAEPARSPRPRAGSRTRQQAVTKRSGPASCLAQQRGVDRGQHPGGLAEPAAAAARAVCRVSAVMAAASAPVPQTSAISTIQRPSGSGMTS